MGGRVWRREAPDFCGVLRSAPSFSGECVGNIPSSSLRCGVLYTQYQGRGIAFNEWKLGTRSVLWEDVFISLALLTVCAFGKAQNDTRKGSFRLFARESRAKGMLTYWVLELSPISLFARRKKHSNQRHVSTSVPCYTPLGSSAQPALLFSALIQMSGQGSSRSSLSVLLSPPKSLPSWSPAVPASFMCA